MSDLKVSLTELEKHIYNTHLSVTRGRQNLPYKHRKDFSNIKDQDFVLLKRLSMFFTKHTHIKIDDFIKAPFTVYQDEIYFDLKFYNTPKAIKTYTIYKSQQKQSDPDCNDQLQDIIESLKFITNFCIDNHIELDNYIEHQNGAYPSFILHLKEYRVNLYCLLGLANFEAKVKAIDIALMDFLFEKNYFSNISNARYKYIASKKAKTLVEQGLIKIKTKIKNTLEIKK